MRARGFRVESICRVLSEQGVQVAPRTYRNWKTATPSARTISDAHVADALRATIGTPEGLYGRRKMIAYLRRQGHRVAACTVDRLMRDEGLSGVIRGYGTRVRESGFHPLDGALFLRGEGWVEDVCALVAHLFG